MQPAFETTTTCGPRPAYPALRGRALAAAITAPTLVLLGAGVIAAWIALGLPTIEAAALQALMLVTGAAFVARRDDTNARRPAAAALDRSTGLFNRDGLFTAAAAAAGDAQEQTTLIVFEFADLREVHDIYGSTVARKLVGRIVRKLECLAGPRGFVGRTDTAQFTVVLPATREDKALRALQRAMGKPARIEFDAGDSEIVLVPEVIMESAEPGEQLPALHSDLCRALVRRMREERRRESWLTRERERHSRPMGVTLRA